jgi:predicted ATPase
MVFGSEADERAVTEMQRRAEHGLRANEVAFLDRALPDYLWFWRLIGLNPNELLAEGFHYRYASVFILDQLPLQLDAARVDDDAYTVLLAEWLTRDYSASRYDVVRVPVLSPQEWLEFVLPRLSEQRLM